MAANPNETPRHFYNLDEYFALEHAGDARYEYWDGDIACMSGGTVSHSRIARNVLLSLSQKLVAGGRCEAFTTDLAVKTPLLPPYRYPDVTVACGDLKFENIRGVDALINPILIVEVLSATTEERDRNEKFTAYKAIESFKEYLLIAQNTVRITHWVLRSDSRWEQNDITESNSSLTLECIDCMLPVREIYEGVRFRRT
jgi:Uma2 family endonuclease